ncbi:3'(2'),5'-bisphosphate nucleotidase CysQ [Amycolatopsis antarctica]|uniref:3'(2'),5'-bisphosphate nucleotidase CysQ n=1 Tax=Amycolatopsis antarctica TaxID=1854586 RepID=A0A263CW92_9PSEU|nr:3'(2'),5'-bisphosphate nucleotidase CysQ [Amycolatopsis antarctica]
MAASGADDELARLLAVQAGQLLLALRDEKGYADPAALRAGGDRAAHEYLIDALARYRPADAVLSEESGTEWRRRDGRVWIVDPLDGTREFAEQGRSDWAVHVARWERGRPMAGAVALPARGEVLTTGDAHRPTPSGGKLRMAVSRSRPPAFTGELAGALDAETRPMGSAGVKIASVVLGETDLYVHAGGQYEWDSAAPVAVALDAGLHASRIDGSPLVYNRDGAWLPDLVVCHRRDADHVLAEIDRIVRGERGMNRCE